MKGKIRENHLKDQVNRLLTVWETAELLHVPTSWIYERSRHDALQSLGMVRIGKYLRFRSDAIEEYINTGGDLKLMKEVRDREATGAEAGD